MKSMDSQKLKDFDTLKKIVNEELNMDDVDFETKMRIINLCAERIEDIDKRIDEYNKKIRAIKKTRL